MHHGFKIGILTLMVLFGTVGLSRAEENSATLANLMTAFNGESNAHARYLAFAQKADEEGYGQVASLFRAAAAAEKVHFGNHAKIITAMGATPKADIAQPDVKSTKENLEAAIKGESYERDTMYPEFIAEAEKSGNKDALRSFNFAKTAEAGHANLYKEALDNLEQQKGGKKTFYVCSVCGATITTLPDTNCLVCNSPKETFLTID